MRPTPFRKQQGVFLIVTAAGILVLLGFVGLAIDSSRQMAVRAELQNAADSCALSAALELNGFADAPARGTRAGQFVGGTRNLQNFQSASVVIPEASITFSTAIDGEYKPAALVSPYTSGALYAPANSRFVRCTVTEQTFLNFFMGLLGIEDSDLSMSATASVQPGQAVCAIPTAACSAGPGPDFGYTVGQQLTLSGGASDVSGFFRWANLLPDTSLSENQKYVQPLINFGACNFSTLSGQCIQMDTGGRSVLTQAWNSRFGLYKTGESSYVPAEALPDLTGLGFPPPSSGNMTNRFGDYLVAAVNRTPAAPIPGFGAVTGVENYRTANRRLTAIPVLQCNTASTSCPSGFGQTVGFACVLMLSAEQGANPLRVEYRGRADQLGSGCVTTGLPGGENTAGPLVPVLVQ
jgi:hypothetical protein